jgi:hypothetical protein
MGWEMWVLMLIGMAGFWAVVLLGIRALFLAGGKRLSRDSAMHPRTTPPPGARSLGLRPSRRPGPTPPQRLE